MMKKESLRLIALPLSTRSKSLIYFYPQRVPRPDQEDLNPTQSQQLRPSSLISPPILIRKTTDFGAKQWAKLADAKDGSWKSKVYKIGERMMDKIPFEEWALKSIDPTSLPPINRSPKLTEDLAQDSTIKQHAPQKTKIELLYPGSLCAEEELMSGLKSSLTKQEPYHRKWMKLNIFLSPLTMPCAIVPLIPNLPFFYMMWRAWSHWRAYNASRYLNQMIQYGHVLPIASPLLDSLYASSRGEKVARNPDCKGALKKQNESQRKEDKSSKEIVLSHEMVLKLQKQLDLPPEAAIEISRGIHQAKQRLENSDNQSKPSPAKL